MTKEELFNHLKSSFIELIKSNDIEKEEVTVFSKSLTPEEAIGITARQDYPILTGKEVILQSQYHNSFGQAFTDAPTDYKGTLADIAALDIQEDSHARALFIATLNTLQKELHHSENVIHCKNQGPELCSKHMISYLQSNYDMPKILQVGYQPAMIAQLSHIYELRVLDLNPTNIGTIKNGVTIEDGIKDKEDAISWADLILCTGSTLCNGSIVDYLNLNKEVLFFGTTLSGAADSLGAKRLCFADQTYQEQS